MNPISALTDKGINKLAGDTRRTGDRTKNPDPPVVIIGTGPVGVRFAQELLKKNPPGPVILYGKESGAPYNRARLSEFLARQVDRADLSLPLKLSDNGPLIKRLGCPVTQIDRENRTVTDDAGQVQGYSTLVMATGSNARIPNIPGRRLTGVYSLRTLEDAERLLSRRSLARHTLILGGGSLGLEAARAMQTRNNRITVIDHNNKLMRWTLDQTAGELLHRHMEDLGIHIRLDDGVREILGGPHVKGVRTRKGIFIPCDTIVLATGVLPNIALAREIGLHVGRGIKVNDQMQTSDPHIYAIGECAEHRGKVYGLISPGFEQAAVAADAVLGGNPRYTGSLVSTSLKGIGLPVFSAGLVHSEDTPDPLQPIGFNPEGSKVYRGIFMQRGRLVGAVALGDWSERAGVEEAMTRGGRIWPWQRVRFRRTGNLWRPGKSMGVEGWPEEAIVCNCAGVTRGMLGRVLGTENCTLERLVEQTGASSLCGLCKPLLVQLAGRADYGKPLPFFKGLFWVSLGSALFIASILLLPPLPVSETVRGEWRWDKFWIDPQWKRYSGFALLVLLGLSLTLSLRKRHKRLKAGSFPLWRTAHTVLGLSLLALLSLHTGLYPGTRLNLALMSIFMALTLAGGAAGIFTALEGKIGGILGRRLTLWGNRVHLFFFRPFPILLLFHILSSYYF